LLLSKDNNNTNIIIGNGNNNVQTCIPRVSSVKTQIIYYQLKWPHVSTQGVIMKPIIEPCLRYIKWKCTFTLRYINSRQQHMWMKREAVITVKMLLMMSHNIARNMYSSQGTME